MIATFPQALLSVSALSPTIVKATLLVLSQSSTDPNDGWRRPSSREREWKQTFFPLVPVVGSALDATSPCCESSQVLDGQAVRQTPG